MSNILERANQIVNHRAEEKDRQYGPFSESIERAAKMYNLMAAPDEQITPEGVFKVLVALKLSREAYNHKEDNLLDAVAYLGALNNYREQRLLTKINNMTNKPLYIDVDGKKFEVVTDPKTKNCLDKCVYRDMCKTKGCPIATLIDEYEYTFKKTAYLK